MRRILLISISILLISASAFGQKYFTRNGEIRFFSATPLENIEAINSQASCIVDIGKGEVVAKVLMEAFQFEKALMQEHFNENYVESDKYPSASLKAQIKNIDKINFESTASQAIILSGELTIHNVTQQITVEGTFTSGNEALNTEAKFIINPEDYDIKIPKAVRDNIAKEIEVTVKFDLKPFNK